MHRNELESYLTELLKPQQIKDFTANGLQIQGCDEIKKIVTGVTASKALIDENTFIGLCIDEDRQAELTDQRVTKWVTQLNDEMCLAELA